MSPLVTRPSLPEPGTVAASMPLSAESFRTDGASGASDGGLGHGLAERRNAYVSHGLFPLCVVAGRVPAIHDLIWQSRTWMPGTSGAKTALRAFCPGHDDFDQC